MNAFICTTCGTQYAPSETPPERCTICEEERQYVLATGQAWTTLPRLRVSHWQTFRDEAGLLGIGVSPSFGIGQRALLVRTPEGNVLWDCVSLVSKATVELINGLGGLVAIAISHPHYYTTVVEWSRAFGGIPIHLHAADREWVMRPDPCLAFWDGETLEIGRGLTLVRAGGHFAGATVLHWADGADGRGAILAGDIIQVVADRKHLGFMRSYPNYLPLGAAAVRAIAARVDPYPYDAIYGAFWTLVVPERARERLEISVERHIAWLERGPD